MSILHLQAFLTFSTIFVGNFIRKLDQQMWEKLVESVQRALPRPPPNKPEIT